MGTKNLKISFCLFFDEREQLKLFFLESWCILRTVQGVLSITAWVASFTDVCIFMHIGEIWSYSTLYACFVTSKWFLDSTWPWDGSTRLRCCYVGNALAQTLQNLESVTAGVITVFVASLQLVFIVLDMLPRNWLNCYIYMKIIVWFSTDAKNVRGSETSSQGFCQKHKNGCLILRRGKIMKVYKKKSEGPMKQEYLKE